MSVDLLDPQGRPVTVPDQSSAALEAKGYTRTGDSTSTNVVDDSGHAYGVPNSQGLGVGEHPETQGEAIDRSFNRYDLEQQAAHDNPLSKAKSWLGSFINGLSLGSVSPFGEDQSAHPYYGIAGGIASVLATLPFGGEGVVGAGADAAKGGEALAEGLGAERAATGATSDVLRTVRSGFQDFTPLGQVTEMAGKLGRYIPGAGPLSKIARTGAGGAFIGGTQGMVEGLHHYLNDPDSDFSGDVLGGLTSNAGWGGVIGLGLGAGGQLYEGLSGLRGKGSVELPRMSADEYSAYAESTAPDKRPLGGYDEPNTSPLRSRVDLGNTPSETTAFDRVNGRLRDLRSAQRIITGLVDAPIMAERAGWEPKDLQALSQRLSAEEMNLKSFMTHADAELPNLAEHMHTNDVDMARMSEAMKEVPSRWSDPEMRAQEAKLTQDAVDSVAKRRASGLEVSPAEEDGHRISAKLAVGAQAADVPAVKDGVLTRLAKKAGLRFMNGQTGGWFGRSMNAAGPAALAGIAVDRALAGGVSSLLGHGAVAVGGLKLGMTVLKAVAANPALGGILAGGAAHVLNSSGLLDGDRKSKTTDARQALRQFADRTRRLTPQAAGAQVARSLSHIAGASPLTVARAAQAATSRHRALLTLLDMVDPAPVTAGQRLLGRPLPKAADAHKTADFVRATSHPLAPVLLAMDGRLTPDARDAHAAAYPAVAQRLNQHLLGMLAERSAHGLPAPRMRTVETLLGPQALGGPGHGAFYRQTMQQLAAQVANPTPPPSSKPTPTPQGASGSPTSSPWATAAQKAANPGAK